MPSEPGGDTARDFAMVEDEKARADIVGLMARSLALKQIVARRLAYQATRSDDPDFLLRHFPDSGDEDLNKLSGIPGHLAFVELVQRELDGIVGLAAAM